MHKVNYMISKRLIHWWHKKIKHLAQCTLEVHKHITPSSVGRQPGWFSVYESELLQVFARVILLFGHFAIYSTVALGHLDVGYWFNKCFIWYFGNHMAPKLRNMRNWLGRHDAIFYKFGWGLFPTNKNKGQDRSVVVSLGSEHRVDVLVLSRYFRAFFSETCWQLQLTLATTY